VKTYPVPKKNKRREGPRVAVGAVVFRDGKILLVKRAKAPQKGTWAIPGGSMKLGETLQAAAERETREETGLQVLAKEPIHTFDLIEKDGRGKILFHYVIVDLHADYISGGIQPADDVSDAGWFGPEEIENIHTSASTRELLHKLAFLK
jgi:8-oxo-dGTP diphosphatase